MATKGEYSGWAIFLTIIMVGCIAAEAALMSTLTADNVGPHTVQMQATFAVLLSIVACFAAWGAAVAWKNSK